MALGTRVQFESPAQSRSQGALAVMSERLSDTIDRGVNYLLSLQASEGYWMGELEADTTLESDYIFYLQVINKAESGPDCQAGQLRSAAATRGWRLEYLLRRAFRTECHN